MYLANILKGKLNRQKTTNTSFLVTTIKEIIKTPIQKMDKPIFSLKIKNDAASRNRKIILAFNGNLGAAIAAENNIPLKYI